MSNMETDLRELFAEKVSSLDVPSDMPVATERRVKTRRSMVVAGAAVCLLIAVASAFSWGDVFDTSSPVKPAGGTNVGTLPDGLLEPGTYTADRFVESFQLTVTEATIAGGLAARGIESRKDEDATLALDERGFMLRDGLTPARLLFVQPFDMLAEAEADPIDPADATVNEIADWFANHPALTNVISAGTTVGGRRAVRIDAGVDDIDGACRCITWHEAFRSSGQLNFVAAHKERIYVIAGSSVPLVFVIEGPDRTFDAFADRAETILGTLRFD
jgi:hypothetical protein